MRYLPQLLNCGAQEIIVVAYGSNDWMLATGRPFALCWRHDDISKSQ